MFSKSFLSGQSLLEVVIALAIFSLIAAAFVSLTLGSVSSVGYGTDWLTAATLADLGVGAARAIRDNAWNNLIAGPSTVGTTTDGWIFTGVGSQTFSDRFNRTITLSPTCRDALDLLAPCPATRPDLETMALKVEVNWPSPIGATQTIRRQTYLANWDSRDWIQTDWSGGSGQAAWSDATRYDSDDGKVDVTAVGTVKLKSLPFIFLTFASPVTQTLNSVHCRNNDDCWAVGNAITSGPAVQRGELILHWDGTNWTRVGPLAAVPNVNLNSVFCLPDLECWAVGAVSSGELILRNASGITWTRLTASGTLPDTPLNSVFCLTVSDCWSVGNPSSGEVTLHWDGTSWSRIGPSAAPDVALNSVFCLTVSDCWSVGNTSGGEVTIRWNGRSWGRVGPSALAPNVVLNDVFCLTTADCFASGASGVILRFDGVNWDTTYDTGSQTWNEVKMWSATNGIIVGSGGAARRFDGSSWDLVVTTPTTQTLNSLIFLSPPPRSGFAVGASGTILELTGGGYETSGSLVSSAFDLGDPSPVQLIGWDESIPVCFPTACTIKFNIRTAATSAGLALTPWSADFTVAAGTLINPSFNGGQFVQYQAQLAGDGISTPVLQEVRINYK